MKSLFADYKTPTMAECEMLGREIGLPKRVVQVWFQNARAKEKKSKLALQKAYGQEPEPSKLPEECKLCAFKYSHKYSVQDHIFTRKHIDSVKAHIESGKLDLSERFPAPPTPVSTPGPGQSSGIAPSSDLLDAASSSAAASTNAAAAAAAILNAGNSSGLNGQQLQQQHQAALFQQLQLLQLAAAGAGASGSTMNNQQIIQDNMNSATELKNMNSGGGGGGDELSFIQLYGLGSGGSGNGSDSFDNNAGGASGDINSSLNPLKHPLMSASSGKSSNGIFELLLS